MLCHENFPFGIFFVAENITYVVFSAYDDLLKVFSVYFLRYHSAFMRLLQHISYFLLAAVLLYCLGISVYTLCAFQGIPPPSPFSSTSRTSSSTAEEYAFTRIGLEQGLSQNSVYALIQDKRGFIWIGTQDGINKYDGYSFISFRNTSAGNIVGSSTRVNGNGHISTIRGTLPNAWVERMVRDKFNNIWISSNGGGLGYIQRDSNTALLMPMLSDASAASQNINAPVLRSSFVTALYPDNAGRMWIGTDKGLHYIDTLKPYYRSTKGNRADVPIRFAAGILQSPIVRNALAGEITALAGDRFGRM